MREWAALRRSAVWRLGPALTILLIIPSLLWAAHHYQTHFGPSGEPLPSPFAYLGGTLFLYAGVVAVLPSVVSTVLSTRGTRLFSAVVVVLALLLAGVCDIVSNIYLPGW